MVTPHLGLYSIEEVILFSLRGTHIFTSR